MNYGRSSGWTIEYSEEVVEDLRALGKPAQLRIRKYLHKLRDECLDPRERGEPYRGNLAGFWKYRIGSYRLLCQICDGDFVILCVLMASHRSRSYSVSSIENLMKRVRKLE